MAHHDDPNRSIMRRMNTPSWLLLASLDPQTPLPATQLMDRMEQRLAQAGLPDEPIDPSTVHYALKRMIDDGLVLHRGKHEVDVPGPYGTTHRALRDVYLITGTGQAALRRKRQLDLAVHSPAPAPNGMRLAIEGVVRHG